MVQCIARSKRSQQQCKNWAIRKKSTCRFHGGRSTGPRTKIGKLNSRQVHINHGLRTNEYIQKLKMLHDGIKTAKEFLKKF